MAYTTASSAELEEEFKSQFGMSISEIQAPSASAEPEPDDVPDTWPAKPILKNPNVILVDVHADPEEETAEEETPEEETVVHTDWIGAVSCRVTADAMEVIRTLPLGSYVEIDQGATHYMVEARQHPNKLYYVKVLKNGYERIHLAVVPNQVPNQY